MEREEKWKVADKHVNRRQQQLRWRRRDWNWMEAKSKLCNFTEEMSLQVSLKSLADDGQLAQVTIFCFCFDLLHTTNLHMQYNCKSHWIYKMATGCVQMFCMWHRLGEEVRWSWSSNNYGWSQTNAALPATQSFGGAACPSNPSLNETSRGPFFLHCTAYFTSQTLKRAFEKAGLICCSETFYFFHAQFHQL